MSNDLHTPTRPDPHTSTRRIPTPPHAVRSTTLLQVWALTMVAFGIAIAAVPWVRIDVFSWVARGDTGLTDAFSADARDYLAFNQSLMGALTAGLGLAAFWIARVPLARRERWAWHAFGTSIGLWFVIDNVASVATGYPRNVVLNLVLVAPLLPLLWATRPGR